MEKITYSFRTLSLYYILKRNSILIVFLLLLIGKLQAQVSIPCNTDLPISLTASSFTDLEVSTGTTGTCILNCGISGENNLIDADTQNYAEVSTDLGLGVSHTLSVSDTSDSEYYEAGGFVGFLLGNSGILRAKVLESITITTYLDGSEQESSTSSSLISLNSSLLQNNQFYAGFYSTMDFDEIEITISSFADVSSNTRIYHAILNDFCESQNLSCNEPSIAIKPNFGLKIENLRTSIIGNIDLGVILNTQDIIDSDISSKGEINFTSGIEGIATLAVKDETTVYDNNIFAGFIFESDNLALSDLLNALTINTYLNGSLQESETGRSLLSIDGNALINKDNTFQLGFIASSPFNEVQLSLTQTALLDLGNIGVYGLVLESLCEGILECTSTTVLNTPEHPVIINSINSVLNSVACPSCTLENLINITSESKTDFALLNLDAGTTNMASISILNALGTYNSGTIAGFALRDRNNIAINELKNSLTFTTYLDGSKQEVVSGSSILTLESTGDVDLGPTTVEGYYTLGLETSMDFDEIQLMVNGLVGQTNNLELYGSFVDSSLKLEANITNETSIGAQDGTITLSVTGGEEPYTYSWTELTANGETISGLAQGTYTVLVTDANDCMITADFSINTDGIQSEIPCNTETPNAITTELFTDLSISQNTVGICTTGCGIFEPNNIIDVDISNYSTVTTNIGLGATHSIRISDETDGEVFTSAGFAGFLIENNTVISSLLLESLEIRTYLDGELQESVSGENIVKIDSDISDDHYYVGFYNSTEYDAVEIAISSLENLLSTTRIYAAAAINLCQGPALECNIATDITIPAFPLSIDSELTGIFPSANLGSLLNMTNVLDSNGETFGLIDINSGTDAEASFSIKNELESFPSQSLVTYEIENSTLSKAQLLDAIILTTYIDGQVSESQSSNSGLIITKTESSESNENRFRIGFITNNAYDEIQFTIAQESALDVGITKLFGLNIQLLCSNTLDCDEVVVLSLPEDPVVFSSNTGVDVSTCQNCDLLNINNTLSVDNSDFASINLDAASTGEVTLSIKDLLREFPIGVQAGFVLRNSNSLSEAQLSSSLSITTYLESMQQEQLSAGAIIISDGSLIDEYNPASTDGYYLITINSTMPFDEIELTISAVPGFENSIELYGTYIDLTNSELCEASELSLLKTAIFNDLDNDGCADVDETIAYTFTIGNEGNSSISSITLTDPMLDGDIVFESGDTDMDGVLDVDETWIYSADYNITQNDIDAGLVSNQATVSGVGINNEPLSDLSDEDNTLEDDPTETVICQNSEIALIKTAVLNDENSDGCSNIGETINYSFTVSNTGNTTISSILLTDDNLEGPISFISGDTDLDNELDIDESWIFSADYNITQNDIDIGLVSNQATVNGLDPNGQGISDLSDDDSPLQDDATETSLCQTSEIALIKTAQFNDENADGCSDSGETITYTFTISNLGNTSINSITISDPLLTEDIVYDSGDIDVDNILDIAEIWTFTAEYEISQEDIDAGLISNQATVRGIDVNGDTLTDLSDDNSILEDDSTETTLCQDSGLALIKSAILNDNNDDGCSDIEDSISYTLTVSNQGNTVVTNIVLVDAMLGGELVLSSGDIDQDSQLDVNEEWVYQIEYAISQEDINVGSVNNQALVTGLDVNGITISDLSDDDNILEDEPTLTTLCQTSVIALIKIAELNDSDNDGCGVVGESITYNFFVTNEGNTELNSVVLTDDLLGGAIALASGDTNSDNILNLGETWLYSADYNIAPIDIENGSVSNQASISALNPNDEIIVDFSDPENILNDEVTITDLCNSSSLSLELIGVFNDDNGNGNAEIGESISYIFRITNTGATKLSDIRVDDPMPGIIFEGEVIPELFPGEFDNNSYSAQYILTEADISNAMVINQAYAVSSNPFDTEVIDTSDDPNNPENFDENNDGEPDDPTIITLPLLKNEEFEIFNGISPDGDGLNDFFRIVGIENFPNNNLKIFNRWGVKVYEVDGYGTDGRLFEGLSDGRITIKRSDELPTGSYFYILKRFIQGQETLTDEGYLYIKRK